jgi:hypothetical protein
MFRHYFTVIVDKILNNHVEIERFAKSALIKGNRLGSGSGSGSSRQLRHTRKSR